VESPHASLVGQCIAGTYRIEEVLGRGGMGLVYRAVHARTERPVAVKVIGSEHTGPLTNEELVREARIAASLNHPNIVRVYELDQTEDGLTYVVMDLVHGEDLARRLGRGASTREVLEWGRQIADALAYVHRMGVLHRDIKPSNVILCDGVCKIIDFGIAKLVPNGDVPASRIIGTPRFMAPEQLRGWTLDARTDIYALGVLLYHALSGVWPFDGPDPLVAP
jgi:serine/threonine-protein kinase